MASASKIKGQLEQGNVDLTNRPRVKNADGSISTVRSMSFGDNGREVLVPTVSDDGRILSNPDAIAAYRKTGKHLGIFSNPDDATAYAQQLHNDQADMVNRTPNNDQWLDAPPAGAAPQSETWLDAPPPDARPVAGEGWQDAPETGYQATKRVAGKGLEYTLKGLGYVGGMSSTAVHDLLNRYKTAPDQSSSPGKMPFFADAIRKMTEGTGLPKEQWDAALRGEAVSGQERVKEMGGPDGGVSGFALGMAHDIATDPSTYLPGIGALSVSNKLAKGAGVWEKMSRPLGTGMQMMGKSIFAAPFKKANAAVTRYSDSARRGASEFTDTLFNNGVPLIGNNFFRGGSKGIGDEITALRKSKGKEIGQAIKNAGGNELISLTPNGAPHVETYMELLRSPDKNIRKQAIDLLSQQVPDFKQVFQRHGELLANHNDKDEALKVFQSILHDVQEPRTLEGLQELKKSYQRMAARSEPMGTNMYAKNALPNTEKQGAMQVAGELGDMVENAIESKMSSSVDGAVSGFGDLKRDYSILRRGEIPATRLVEQAMARPALSKLDLLLGLAGTSTAHIDPRTLAVAAAAKVGHEVTRNPLLGTTVGRIMNDAGKLNAWDAMLRQGLINKAREPK